jgi:hypothetical protein
MTSDGKKGDGGSGSEGAAVQLVVWEVSDRISYPILMKLNYSDWALLMKVKLKARVLWNAIKYGGSDVQEEMMALDTLCSVIPQEMTPSIVKMETAKEAWEAIATMRVGNDRVRKATAQQIRRKFDMATCNEGETVEDYALCLNSLAAHLSTLCERIKEGQIVEKMLRTLPPQFRQISIVIKTLLDVLKMSVADLTGHLKEAEETFEEPPVSM